MKSIEKLCGHSVDILLKVPQIDHQRRVSYIDKETMDTDVKWLKWVEAQFKDVAGEDQLISPDEFKRTLKVKEVG